MKRLAAFAIGAGLATVCFAQNPPGLYEPFDCSTGGGTTSCATGDGGCVPETNEHLKCSRAIVKAFAKAIAAVNKCHCKQATALFANAPFDEEDCEGSTGKGARAKFEGAIAKAGDCSATQISLATTEEELLFGGRTVTGSLDQQNGDTFCDSTSGAMISSSDDDDAGFVPADENALECACTVGRNLAKLIAQGLQCHMKMADSFFKGNDFDEAACEESGGKSAFDKYAATATKLVAKGGCPSCLDVPHQTALGTNALAEVEAIAALGYPCTESTAACGASTCPDACGGDVLADAVGPCEADSKNGTCNAASGENCCTCGVSEPSKALDGYLKKLNDNLRGKATDISDAVTYLPDKCRVVVTKSERSAQPSCTLSKSDNSGSCLMPRVILFCGDHPEFMPSFGLCPTTANSNTFPRTADIHHLEIGLQQGPKPDKNGDDAFLEMVDIAIDLLVQANNEVTPGDIVSKIGAAPGEQANMDHGTKGCADGCHGGVIAFNSQSKNTGKYYTGALHGREFVETNKIVDSTDKTHPAEAPKGQKITLEKICACIAGNKDDAAFKTANAKIAAKLCANLQTYKAKRAAKK